MMLKRNRLWLLAMGLILAGCQNEGNFKEQLEKALSKNPDIIFKMIEKHPDQFLQSFQVAIDEKKKAMARDKEKQATKEIDYYVKNPLKVNIRKDDVFKGKADADIILVEFTDFQCPFCKRSNETIRELTKLYPGRIKIVYKHLPLSFHPQSQIAAQYFEAIKLQNKEKAFKFHEMVFQKQGGLSKGVGFLNKLAVKVGADQGKIKRDLYSEKIIQRIKEDSAEASSLGLNGTPGFVLNGVPIRGAYPLEYFKMVIEKLDKQKKEPKDS